MHLARTVLPAPAGMSLSQCDTWDTWDAVKGALEDQGFRDARPAPSRSLAFVPRHLRQESARG